jgi:uncharacterized protein YndB with AHSA1/START domain
MTSEPIGQDERAVLLSRAFDAPRHIVFDFFTRPERLVAWFGPAGYDVALDTVTVERRVGGRYELTMRDGEGAYRLHGHFTVFDAPELLVLELDSDTKTGGLDGMELRLQFHDHGHRTRVTLRQAPLDSPYREDTTAGWLESFDKLEALLAA